MRVEIIFSYYTTLLLNWQTFFCHSVNFREYTDYVLMNFANFVIFPENTCPHQTEFVKELAILFIIRTAVPFSVRKTACNRNMNIS